MLSTLSAVLFLLMLALLARARPWVLLTGFFLVVLAASRTVSAWYIDLAGPLYAEQLERDIGGGTSAPVLVLALFTLIAALAIALRPGLPLWRELTMRPVEGDRTRTFVGAALMLFVVCLYADLLRRGVIPLFSGMERYDYTANHAGPLHRFLFEHGFIVATALGAVFVHRKLARGAFELRALAMLLALFAYGVLTGHRFSIFYQLSSFFLIPVGAYVLGRHVGMPVPSVPVSPWERMVGSRWFHGTLILLAVLLVAGTLANSFLNVREYGDDATDKLVQRVLIQPSELWWVTWDRVAHDRIPGWQHAADLLFDDPIDADRNTGIQLLMANALGHSGALHVLDQTSQFAGGYPEVLIEALGPVVAWIPLLALAAVVGWLLREICHSMLRGHLLSVITLTYVFYAFSLHYVGGMLNFFLVWTFWAKVLAAVLAMLIERRAWHPSRMGLPDPQPAAPSVRP